MRSRALRELVGLLASGAPPIDAHALFRFLGGALKSSWAGAMRSELRRLGEASMAGQQPAE